MAIRRMPAGTRPAAGTRRADSPATAATGRARSTTRGGHARPQLLAIERSRFDRSGRQKAFRVGPDLALCLLRDSDSRLVLEEGCSQRLGRSARFFDEAGLQLSKLSF
jgi:hypothetical protein